MWKDVLKTGAILAATAGGMVLSVGFIVPREHEAGCEALLRKRPQDVWETVADVQGWREWMPGVDFVVAIQERNEHPTYQVTGPEGSVVVEVEEETRPRRLVFFTTGEHFSERRTFSLTTDQDLTILKLEETGDRDNPLERGMTVFEDPHDELLALLVALAEQLGVSTIPEVL